MTLDDMAHIRDAFVAAARREQRIGIEDIELHDAHGYLLHEFLYPITNQRTDAYGGSPHNRMRFPLEVFAAVRQAFDGPVGMRMSATDWEDGGWDLAWTTELFRRLKALGCDFIHVSSGGASLLQKIAIGPGNQVLFADHIRKTSGMTITAVGLITQPQQAEDILHAGDADRIALAGALIYRPRWPWEAVAALGATVTALSTGAACRVGRRACLEM